MTDLLPFDEHAEASVLSHVLWHHNREALDAVAFLRPEHFYLERHRVLYQALREIDERGESFDATTVAVHLHATANLERAGGMPYLLRVSEEFSAQSTETVTDLGRVIFDCWRSRQLIDQCQLTIARLKTKESPLKEILSGHEQAVGALALDTHHEHLKLFSEVVGQQLQLIQQREAAGLSQGGLSTGYSGLDNKTGGFFAGDLIVLAARPGMGKTALALNLARNVAKPRIGKPVATAVFSLEMPVEQVAMRVLCGEASVPVTSLREKTIPRDAWPKLINAADRLKSLPLWIDDTPAISVMEVRARVRQLKRLLERGAQGNIFPQDLGLVVIDYLQLMQGERSRNGNREQEVASITRSLKQLAKQEQVPVIVLSQLSRGAEDKKDQRPALRDLRESGAIEQDADSVWFLYRQSYYDRNTTSNDVELDVAKQRQGATGVVSMTWKPETMRFYDPAYSPELQEDIASFDDMSWE